jgi:hypothetical protein
MKNVVKFCRENLIAFGLGVVLFAGTSFVFAALNE